MQVHMAVDRVQVYDPKVSNPCPGHLADLSRVSSRVLTPRHHPRPAARAVYQTAYEARDANIRFARAAAPDRDRTRTVMPQMT